MGDLSIIHFSSVLPLAFSVFADNLAITRMLMSGGSLCMSHRHEEADHLCPADQSDSQEQIVAKDARSVPTIRSLSSNRVRTTLI
jgi:hypothetical protein